MCYVTIFKIPTINFLNCSFIENNNTKKWKTTKSRREKKEYISLYSSIFEINRSDLLLLMMIQCLYIRYWEETSKKSKWEWDIYFKKRTQAGGIQEREIEREIVSVRRSVSLLGCVPFFKEFLFTSHVFFNFCCGII